MFWAAVGQLKLIGKVSTFALWPLQAFFPAAIRLTKIDAGPCNILVQQQAISYLMGQCVT